MQTNYVLFIYPNKSWELGRTNAKPARGKRVSKEGVFCYCIIAPNYFVQSWVHRYIHRHSLKPFQIVKQWDKLVVQACQIWNTIGD